jgi:histidyl-tRNA synthetase
VSEQDAIKAPRGTFDVLDERSAARTAIEQRARALLEGAGYERIETPTFEATELFSRGVGSSTDIVRKEMYTFSDGSGRSLTLRPEGTAPVCRAYLEHGMHKRPAPVKLWYMSSFYRYERAQSGRYRQFWQVGAEALGSDDPAVDAESIALLMALLGECGVRAGRLRISSLGNPESRSEYRERLQGHLRAHEEHLSADVRERIDDNPLRAFDSSHGGTQTVMGTAPRLLDHLSAEDSEHFAEVCALLDGVGVVYEIDSTLVRGLDYYTRTVFELTSEELGAQSGVGGGGRYDGLVELLGGPPTPGMGWAAGVERIALAGNVAASASAGIDLYVGVDERDARDEHVGGAEEHGGGGAGRGAGPGMGLPSALRERAFGVLCEARRAGLAAQMEMSGHSLKGQLKQANRLGARYAAIVGSEGVTLKDMQDGGEQRLDEGTVVHAALRGLRDLA